MPPLIDEINRITIFPEIVGRLVELAEELAESMHHDDHSLRLGIQRAVIVNLRPIETGESAISDKVRQPGLQFRLHILPESVLIKCDHCRSSQILFVFFISRLYQIPDSFRYFSCSGVSTSMDLPRKASFFCATSISTSSGTSISFSVSCP